MTGKRGKAHHGGTHATLSARIRAAAWADPTTQCWKCHRTMAELPLHRTGRAPWWTGGHVVDGQVGGAELPECSHCACKTGADLGNSMRQPTSEEW